MEKMYETGLVSVVIPTYKRSDMLERAIESVRNQTYNNLEILVVNDNIEGDEHSVLLEQRMLKYASDKRVILVRQSKHINGAAARNAGIRLARGEYLAFLDDDDWWENTKIEEQVGLLKQLPKDWGGVSCLWRRYKCGKLVFASIPYKDGMINNEVLQRRIEIGTGSLLMRREAVDECGYFDENLKRHQDVQFFAYFTEKYKIKLIKKYLYNYNVDDSRNRPNSNSILEIKNSYYTSVKSILNKKSKKEINQFYIMNNYEIAISMFVGHKFKEFAKYFITIFRYPSTFIFSIKRIFERLINSTCYDYLVKKYR